MDIREVNIELKSGNEHIKIGKHERFRLLRIEGISYAAGELHVKQNTFEDGSSINNSRLKYRPIMLEIEYTGGNSENIRRKTIDFFNIHKAGTLAIDYGGEKYEIEYRPERFQGSLDNIRRPFKALVDLYCPNPYFKDVVETRVDVSTLEGNWSFPWGIPETGYEMTIRTISFVTNVYNGGSVEVPIRMSLTATGTVDNPVVTNLATGEYIRVNRALTEGDELEIDTQFGNKRVEIIRSNGERENAFHYIDYKSTFFTIASGDTEIEYGADVGDNNLDVYIYYTPRYLGV